jgi:hypothetical protein
MEFDTKIKLKIYEMIASSAVMPTSIDIAEELGETVQEVEASFNRLYAKRLLVLEPDKTSEIRMAPPFFRDFFSQPEQLRKILLCKLCMGCIWSRSSS